MIPPSSATARSPRTCGCFARGGAGARDRAGSTPKRRSGIVVHATRSLPRADTFTRLAVPCTTVERTIIDLAATEDWPTVERAVEQAFALRLIGRTRMRDALDRANGRKGASSCAA